MREWFQVQGLRERGSKKSSSRVHRRGELPGLLWVVQGRLPADPDAAQVLSGARRRLGDDVDPELRRCSAGGSGARRQRSAYARRGDIQDVLSVLARETLPVERT